jgi:hypothetical protein
VCQNCEICGKNVKKVQKITQKIHRNGKESEKKIERARERKSSLAREFNVNEL